MKTASVRINGNILSTNNGRRDYLTFQKWDKHPSEYNETHDCRYFKISIG